MKSQVSLLLVCMLFSKALSLTCNQCLPTATQRPCTNVENITCPNQCLTTTMSVHVEGTSLSDVSYKTCGLEELCKSSSLDLGSVTIYNNAKCCSTDLCNSETLPAFSQQPLNGRMCYKCDTESCKVKLNCRGSEDRCISASVKYGSETVIVKGCASKNVCTSSEASGMSGVSIMKMSCCEGNLCNGAESFTLSFLLMLVPLLSSFLFY